MIELNGKFVTGMVVGAEFIKEDDEEIEWLFILSLFIIQIMIAKVKT